MYVYLYDNFLRQKKYDSALKAIETRLTDYEIAGKIIRLQSFSNTKHIIDEEMRRGATTVVIVGNDATFGHVLSRGATCDVTFGFLPMGNGNTIAQVLGIPEGVESCDVLSRRRVVRLDVGWVNNRYFVSQLHVFPHDVSIEYDDSFSVFAVNKKMELVVCNLQPFYFKNKNGTKQAVHPQDGKLEAFIRPLARRGVFKDIYEEPSVFPFEEMVVRGKKPFLVEADGKQSKETKLTIRLAKSRIAMVVGKDRRF
ncbi:hypothetical protein H6758_01665 [Candidatus Nomurabacteria bacterium]|nr:hypothetical protein [Candidatus Nomurabacteria bacterium]